ncbi:MAG: phosphatase PAP2 family protein [Terriglobales bacterium]
MSSPANVFKATLTVAAFAIVLALAVNAEFYKYSIVDVFMALALGAAFVTLSVMQPSWMNFASVAVCSVVLAEIDYRVMGFRPRVMAPFAFVGLSSLAVLGARTIWARNRERTLLLYALLPAVASLGSEYLSPILMRATEALHPKTLDLYLYSFDCSLRIQFSFLVGQMFARHEWLNFAGTVFYIALPLPLALVYAANLRLKGPDAFPVMLAFLATGPIGILYYNLVPATGPIHIFGQNFPWHPLSTPQAMNLILETLAVKGPRNAIPSLHMTWVLLVWWNSKGLARWIRAVALAFVIFTVLATLGIGEHYFVDLIVAFPFALMVQSLCLYSVSLRQSCRGTALLFGTLVSLAWMALVSFATPFFWLSPVIPWTMVIATISASSFLAHRLQSAEVGKTRVQLEAVAEARPLVTG